MRAREVTSSSVYLAIVSKVFAGGIARERLTEAQDAVHKHRFRVIRRAASSCGHHGCLDDHKAEHRSTFNYGRRVCPHRKHLNASEPR